MLHPIQDGIKAATKEVDLRSMVSKSTRFLSTGVLLTTGLWICLAASAHATEAARVLFAAGEVHAIAPNGVRQNLGQGDVVLEGTTLVVGSGRLQLRFVDGALMSLKPHSRFEIKAYQFTPGNTQSAKAETRLVEGGLRTLTGAIGKVKREAYRLETATGTIGIRGTEFVTDGTITTLYEGVAEKQPSPDLTTDRPLSPRVIPAGFSAGADPSKERVQENNRPTFTPPPNVSQTDSPIEQVSQTISPAIDLSPSQELPTPEVVIPPPPPPPRSEPSPTPPEDPPPPRGRP
jgi:hypothetical protein